jgi:group I intron endonuclease
MIETKKICGIYQIKNIINGKIYIGSSTDLNKRWKEHQSSLNNNKYHFGKRKFQDDWMKYGKNNFKFEILENVKKREYLIYMEQKYLDWLFSFSSDLRYNRNPSAHLPPSRRGKNLSQEVKNKIKNSMLVLDRRGNKNPAALLNDEIIKKIRDEYKNDKKSTFSILRKKYNVSNSCIQAIIENRSWFDSEYCYLSRKKEKQ